MMKPVVFHPEAVEELDDATAYYAKSSILVAARFTEAVEAGVHAIAQHPERQAFLRTTGKRAFRLTKFPYHIVYEELPDRIWVNAVAHERRHPDYWKDRK
ncbi:MAG: type II toxin-antitoxin system RelE/ParE family toxin [Prosthecobacter sp.]